MQHRAVVKCLCNQRLSADTVVEKSGFTPQHYISNVLHISIKPERKAPFSPHQVQLIHHDHLNG